MRREIGFPCEVDGAVSEACMHCVCGSEQWAFVCNHVRQAVMNGVFETERSVEFLGLDQIGNRKTNIPSNPPPTPLVLCTHLPPVCWPVARSNLSGTM